MKEPVRVFKGRLFFLFSAIVFGFVIIAVRLFFIQVLQADELSALANEQHTRAITIPAERGMILDRNGVKLAFSVKTYTVWAKPKEITDVSSVITQLKSVYDFDEGKAGETLVKGTTQLTKLFVKIDYESAMRIKALKLKGVWISDDIKRVYPYNNFLSQVIGHTNDDNEGLVGLELLFNKDLEGIEGKLLTDTDASGRQLANGQEKIYEPIDGLNVRLTIDEVIQHFTEKACELGFSFNQPKRVMAIVMDVKTGAILSMVTKPDYDLNQPRAAMDSMLQAQIDAATDEEKNKLWAQMWRNPIVSDLYEPGSTFKLLTGAMGVEENVVSRYSNFECLGSVNIAGHKIRCWSYKRPHGKETFEEGMQNSCNPVFIEIGLRLGRDKMYDYLVAFGYNSKTGIELPAEASGLIGNRERIGKVELATISFGHGISITPLQMITGLSVIANNGVLMKPHIVDALLDNDMNVVQSYKPEAIRQVLSEETTQEIRDIMETVVSEGSGKNAYIPGYRIGGKTGTANKLIDGKYVEDKVFASFAAIAPIDDPRIAVVVVVDEPSGERFGSIVAAPIVREILENTLRYLEIPPNKIDVPSKQLPNLVGLTVAEAEVILKKMQLDMNYIYEGQVSSDLEIIEQFPKTGSTVDVNSYIMLYLGKKTE
jgi:stage V sporulation protein D (sporulation-specific penicillin-binding protein)